MRPLLALALTACMLHSEDVVVRFGKLWDGEKVIDNAVVVIRSGRIENVSSATTNDERATTNAVAAAATVDWSRSYACPA